MKKVNLINKKVMSTGLAASLLVTSLGAATCYANPTDNDSQPKSSPQISEAKTFEKLEKLELEISESDSFERFTKTDLPLSSSESNKQQKSTINANAQTDKKESSSNIEVNEESNSNTGLNIQSNNENSISAMAQTQEKENESNIESHEESKSTIEYQTKKDNQKLPNLTSKRNVAKRFVKTAAFTSIAAAAAYLTYKYRTPITEHLVNGGQYIINTTNALKNNVSDIFNTYSSSIQNGFTNKARNLTNTIVTQAPLFINETKATISNFFNRFARPFSSNKKAHSIYREPVASASTRPVCDAFDIYTENVTTASTRPVCDAFDIYTENVATASTKPVCDADIYRVPVSKTPFKTTYNKILSFPTKHLNLLGRLVTLVLSISNM